MKNRMIFIFSFTFLMVCLAASPVQTKKILIGIYDDPPAIYVENNKPGGYFYDIFQKVFSDAGYETSYKYGTWDDIVGWLKNGDIDAIFDIAPTAERKKYFDFNNETIFLSWGVIYGNKNTRVSTLYDLKKLKISVVKGDVYYEGNNDSLKEVLLALNIKPDFIETGDFNECTKKVVLGEADVCVVPREFADFVLRNNKDFVQTPIIFKPTSVNIGFKKDSVLAKELIPYIDKVLAKEKLDDRSFYYEAINKYTNNSIIYKDNVIIEKVVDYKIIVATGLITMVLLVVLNNFVLKKKIKTMTADLVKINEELKETSVRDYLTGLYNRRYFEEIFEREITAAKRYGRNLSVIIVDIDYFKGVNDTFGHQTGDFVLKKVGELLLKNIRSGDVICRYGGEEFAICLLEANLEQAKIIAEKLRKFIEAEVFENFDYRLTITSGISGYSDELNSMEKIVSKADQALYVGKNNGRNQVVVYNDEINKIKSE